MASDEQLFTPGDAKLLVNRTASTLNTIASYLDTYGGFDSLTTRLTAKQMYNLVGSCTRLTTNHELQPVHHQLKNALCDIVQACFESDGKKDELLLEYLGTLCTDDEDKRDTPAYGHAALVFAELVSDIFLRITTRTWKEVKSMDKNAWTLHKNLFLMRLAVIGEWRDTLNKLSHPCLSAVQAHRGDHGSEM